MNKKKVIDLHHHLFPPKFEAHPWDVRTDASDMEELGITGVMLSCPVPMLSSEVRMINEYLKESSDFRPDKYGFLASLPFDDPQAALDEIEDVLHKEENTSAEEQKFIISCKKSTGHKINKTTRCNFVMGIINKHLGIE